jgi:hypothetical protein
MRYLRITGAGFARLLGGLAASATALALLGCLYAFLTGSGVRFSVISALIIGGFLLTASGGASSRLASGEVQGFYSQWFAVDWPLHAQRYAPLSRLAIGICVLGLAVYLIAG